MPKPELRETPASSERPELLDPLASSERPELQQGGWRPRWPAPPGVRAWCSTRNGGSSQGEYASLNLGQRVNDDPGAVAENRRRLQATLGVRPVFLQQVHGVDTVELQGGGSDDAVADGSSTTERRLVCTILVADCLPVLFVDRMGTRVAAAHAGWRGLALGVLERTVATFRRGRDERDPDAPPLIAWLGPCIGPKSFEVGGEVKAAFEAADAGAAACFCPAASHGKWLADLPALARRRLAHIGIEDVYGNDGSDAWCTVRNPALFFSHRRDGRSGRFAACIWLD
ncbi:MAG: peptidoglycan editing factor PgeF [Variovorax sp.]